MYNAWNSDQPHPLGKDRDTKKPRTLLNPPGFEGTPIFRKPHMAVCEYNQELFGDGTIAF